jgi:hypothetical protein
MKASADSKNTEEGLETSTGTGKPVRKRFATAQAASNVFRSLLGNYSLVADTRAKIQGMYDGNPPYDAAELLRLGQSYRCNVNFREMESIIDTNTSAAWSLHLDVNTLIEVKMNPKLTAKDPLSRDWESVIAEEYTRLLLRWNGFYTNLNLSLHEYFLFGVGFSVWPDEWDWRSKSFKSGNALVPGMASSDIDKQGLIMIRDNMEAGDLYRIVEDSDNAKKRGWNIAALKELLVRTYVHEAEPTPNGEDPMQTSPWESLQMKLKTGDPDLAMTEFEGVRIVHVIVKEVYGDKKISHYIIAEDEGLQDKWLYEGYQKYAKMKNIVWMLPYSYSDGYLRSSKGMGHRSFPHCEFSNRLLCTTFDGGSLSASLLVQPKTGLDAARLSLVRMGPITMLPENLSVVQTSFMPNISNLVQLRGLSKDILHNNTGVFRPRNEATNTEAPKTAQQVRSEESREARFERNQVEHFYTQWQLWHEETFRRLTRKEYINSELDLPGLEEAKEFVSRCEERGVPKSVLLDPKSMEITVSRAIGMGSPSVKLDTTNQLMMMKGSMSEEGRNIADREWASARLGYWNVDKFFPKINTDTLPSNAGSFAVVENNDMAEGKAVLVGLDQQHYIHLIHHFDRVQGLVKATQEGAIEPMAALQELMVSLPHASEHAQNLAKDVTRKDQVGKAVAMLKDFNKFFMRLQQVVKSQMEQQQQAQQEAEAQQPQGPQLSGEEQIELEKMRGELQLEAAKQESLNAMRAAKTRDQMDIKRVQTEFNNTVKAQQVAAELERKSRLLEADLAIKQAKI